MTATTDVAIVGGGITGCATAFFTTAAGAGRVVLFERRHVASGATGICPGGIRQQFEGEADCRLAQRAVAFYDDINGHLRPEMPFVFERSGYLFLAESAAMLERCRRNVALQNALGIPSCVLDAAEITRLAPALRLDGVDGGAFCDRDGFIEDCHGVANTFAIRARERGATVVHQPVLRLERTRGSWVVHTPGASWEAGAVVVANGADAVDLLRPLGVEVPIIRARRRLAFSEPARPGRLAPLVVALERGFAGKQLASGVIYMGWLGESEADPELAFLEETLRRGASLLADLEHLGVRRVLAGDYDNTPDRRPILGVVPGLDGLLLAVGFSGHGFMVAPAVGEAITSLLAGTPPPIPLEPFSLARFAGNPPHEGLVV